MTHGPNYEVIIEAKLEGYRQLAETRYTNVWERARSRRNFNRLLRAHPEFERDGFQFIYSATTRIAT
jgi:hypothetical protein